MFLFDIVHRDTIYELLVPLNLLSPESLHMAEFVDTRLPEGLVDLVDFSIVDKGFWKMLEDTVLILIEE